MKSKSFWAITGVIILFLLFAIAGVYLSQGTRKESPEIKPLIAESKMKISSPVFEHNQTIPVKYTCDGVDVNPPLIISDIPEGTKSLALIADDPDAPMGTWVHWTAWNIPPNTKEIQENEISSGAIEGMTDFKKPGYGGPCPPKGHGVHRYFFKLYALDAELDLPAGADKEAIEKAIEGHILAEARIFGLYRRD
ncbi:hypothetical protein A2W39_01600 [Candidatus Azambacteria bacterium RIFCSPHIGHO2_01_46_10]|uniref:YbhB/YbcL family Raf kinase inhibitor-like protein n=2 Tax=Candidatus Azamiibacteriota TaxID=1752741 RepID=A0A1F5C638_9BACT|nr:MAG: hypothetical protein A2W39_01600 [Candidatus Azambacteria bacterium RIFCSPHIGHO2_01_46_10]OGD38285.1 MAG: hypothetical protein A3A25_00925 [Candidatus Azambacteria bacterium RIFCSPLOWO2_01_FULL_46_26]